MKTEVLHVQHIPGNRQPSQPRRRRRHRHPRRSPEVNDAAGGRRADSSSFKNEQLEVPPVGAGGPISPCMKQGGPPRAPPMGPGGQPVQQRTLAVATASAASAASNLQSCRHKKSSVVFLHSRCYIVCKKKKQERRTFYCTSPPT